MKTVVQIRNRKKALVKLVILGVTLWGVFFFLNIKRQALREEAYRTLQEMLSRQTDLDIKIGKISVNVLGFVRFRDVGVKAPWLPEGRQTVFKANEVQLRYRLLDFLSKNVQGSRIEVRIERPQVYWRPAVRIRTPTFPVLSWVKQWALSEGRDLRIQIEGMDLWVGDGEKKLSGIDVSYENSTFRLEIPLTHAAFGSADVSSVISVDGHLDIGGRTLSDILTGQISTSGTVINWRPLPRESKFDFALSGDELRVSSSDVLGDIAVKGTVDFAKDYDIDLSIQAKNTRVSDLSPLLGLDPGKFLPGRMDVDIHFKGAPWAPAVEIRSRFYEGWVGKKPYKAMDVNAAGIYPTLRLVDSKILLPDGSRMRFAEDNLEARDLFKEKTYEALVAEAQQDTVVWGDWEFSRPRNSKDQPEFLMQRNLGENAKLHFRKMSYDSENPDPSQKREMEVGFEYRLKSKDFLKLELRDDEEFIGVERKLKF